MIAAFIIGFFCVVLAYFAGLYNRVLYLKFSFFILFVFLAIRYDYGSDYMAYYYYFDNLKKSSWSEINKLITQNNFGETIEFGYVIINKIFSSVLNFHFFIAFHSYIFCFVFYKLIVKYVPIKYSWIALFILIFHPNLMVFAISGLRQAIAIFTFVYSIQFLIKRDFVKYLMCILFAVLFHYSAIILLPLYFVITTKQVTKIEPIIYLIFYFIILFFGEFLLQPIQFIVENYLPKYNSYIQNKEANTISSGLGVLANLFLNIIVLFYARKKSNQDIIFYRLVALFIIISPVSLVITNLARLALYFAPALIVVLPNLMNNKNLILVKRFALVLIFFLYLFGAYRHYTSEITKEKNYNYKTVLSIM